MVLIALSLLIGVVFVQQQAELPGPFASLMVLFLLGWLLAEALRRGASRYRAIIRVAIFTLAGAVWAVIRAQDYLDQRLPEAAAGQDIQLTGVVSGIPVERGHVQRFFVDVKQIDVVTGMSKPPSRLRISWYHGVRVKAGEHWRFLVRLKPPHGFFNAGGFDYEAWLYQQGVHATGYVRNSEINQKLADASLFSLDSARQQLSLYIQQTLKHHPLAGLITALAVGDRSPISQQHWDQLINTGTNHLMAISGLHIGLAAGFGFWIVRRTAPAYLLKHIAAQRLAISGGLLVALLYALLAGLSIPTQRALLMLTCFALALFMKRNYSPQDALATAMIAILVWDPAAVLSAGFWFSFIAVGVIFYVFSGRMGIKKVWKQWGWMQCSIALALFPLSLMLFQQTSLVSPLANFVMVPYVSFLVVPLVLLSILSLPVSELISRLCLDWAASLLEFAWPLLVYLAESGSAYWMQAGVGPVEAGVAMLGVILLLAPRGVPARWLGLIFILPVLSEAPQRPDKGDFVLDLLDVGQGLAAVIRTEKHTLVFDTGARFSSQLDAGDAVVVPFLRQLSVDRIDRIVISHGDADHIGGVDSLLSAFPSTELVGQDISTVSARNKTRCIRGQQWRWDEVDFEFLHPDEQSYSKQNNRSCVLKISGAGGRLLLTGDIESKVERRLLSRQANELEAEVLVVPHHGSKTSSSRGFIQAVAADIVLFPLGYRNRYRFPNKDVAGRYLASGARLLSSGHSGAIRVVFDAEKGVYVADEHRKSHARYWNHQPLPGWL